jgi:mannose-6-phosphate isomerase-like protein (cupin superfamily)
LYIAAMRTLLALSLSVAALSAADNPVIYKTEAELVRALAAGQATPDMLTSAVSNGDHHRINVVRRTKAAGATAHPGFAELHHIMEGSGTLVTGGTIVRPAGGRGAGGATIDGGESRHVSKGDVILVPSGVPHWYKDLDGAAITYLEVRWEEK